MKRRIIFSCIIAFVFTTLTGCWDRRELNQLGIVSALGIDKTNSGYEVTAQIVNPGDVAVKQGGGGRTPVTTYTAKAATVFEAIRKVSVIAPRKLYFAHLQMLVIGEKLASIGIGKSLELMYRDHEFRHDFFITIAKGNSAKNILSVLTPVEKIPSQNMFAKLENSEETWAPTIGVRLDDLISSLIKQGRSPVLTGIKIEGNQKMAGNTKNLSQMNSVKLAYSDLAVFQNDKLVGWLNEEESKGYNYSQGNVKNTIGHITCSNGGKVALEMVRTTANTKGYVIHDVPKIVIRVFVECNIGEIECEKIDVLNQSTIQQLEKQAAEKTQNMILKAIHKTQKELKSDIFGFGETISRDDPNGWRGLANNWDKKYLNANVTVQVEYKIRRTGKMGNSFLSKLQSGN